MPISMTAADLRTAIAHHKAGRLGEAERLYRSHLAKRPEEALALSNLGLIVQDRGDHGAALDLFQEAIALQPRFVGAHVHRGKLLAELGRYSEARDSLERALALKPDSAEALAALAALRQRQGDIWDAILYWRRAAEAAPALSDVRQNLGLALGEVGRFDEAIAVMEVVLKESPGSPIAHSNMAALLRQAGRLPAAIAAGRRAIVLAPQDANAHYNLAMAVIDNGDRTGGLSLLEATLRLAPNHVDALNVMGMHHRTEVRHDEALACFEKAAAAAPRHLGILLNIGVTMLELGRLQEALQTYRHALSIDAWQVAVLINLGATLEQMGRSGEALDAYRKAIALDPQNGDAHFNHGLALLALGQFKEGWREYEWRRRALVPLGARSDLGPNRWTGEPIAGRRILIHAEQGIGDSIQFARYLPLLREGGALVTFECQQSLCRLIESAGLAESIVARGEVLPAHDTYASLLSLPGLLGTAMDSIPAPVGYLHADPAESQIRRRQLASLKRPLIGIAWQGNPAHKADRRRSIPLAMLAAAFQGVEATLVSLQVGHGQVQIATMPAGVKLFDPFAELPASDFASTAAVIDNLDLVVTVDTAVAHLAGAMGRPTWVLLPQIPDWRWLQKREDTPWYPTMRLFRQDRPGGWSFVVARLAEALRSWHP